MIRTNSVTLTSLPSALAYRRKGASGDAAIVIVRADEPQPGIATISKTSGEPIIAANTPKDAYPAEAFAEAIELTKGMPYRKQGKPRAPDLMPTEPETAEEQAEEVIVDSGEYQAIIDAYTDKGGKFSFDLMNKDLIQLAHRSSVARRMVAEGQGVDVICTYVVGARFRNLTGNAKLSDEQVAAMAELLDEVSPKSAFKELKAEIRASLAKTKRA